tara:strand:- start:4416 stop:4589 length:174 start_codon:yes stop_codon:yes gene_type:complete
MFIPLAIRHGGQYSIRVVRELTLIQFERFTMRDVIFALIPIAAYFGFMITCLTTVGG